jgi:hypothetical protein
VRFVPAPPTAEEIERVERELAGVEARANRERINAVFVAAIIFAVVYGVCFLMFIAVLPKDVFGAAFVAGVIATGVTGWWSLS